ncbi:MAG TPA: LysR family transcriptional regulator [Candidatus Ruminococcus avistercoris]|nr:LysR family transcriptional regulator [Candidatus Ruminococcus avistercoris]
MTIQELEYFKIICREKSITKAARQLYITPQGLSKTLKNLESELQTTLLNRNTSGVTLTETGQYLCDHLDTLLTDYYALRHGIREITQRQNHEIDLLSAYGILRLVTPDCITAFREKYHHISVHYREYPDKQVERLFAAQEGNVAFTIGPADFSPWIATPLEQFEVCLLVNRSHPLSKKTSVTIQDLKDEPIYLESSEFQIHHMFMEKCRLAGFTPHIVFETSGFSLCHKMVRANKGVSLSLGFMFDDMSGDDTMVLIPFSDGSYPWETYMLTREKPAPNSDLKLFRDHILEWMNEIKAGKRSR